MPVRALKTFFGVWRVPQPSDVYFLTFVPFPMFRGLSVCFLPVLYIRFCTLPDPWQSGSHGFFTPLVSFIQRFVPPPTIPMAADFNTQRGVEYQVQTTHRTEGFADGYYMLYIPITTN